MSGQPRCRSCEEPITWGFTDAGRRAPFNVSDGQNHFISCPHRREWRKAEPPMQASFLDDEPTADSTRRRHWDG